ncbi:MAG: O-antigen ligase family protein, partial [Rhizobiales bacterium]|nr:O-antigen ligase family protein [Hyphomicrobiales bacterium]
IKLTVVIPVRTVGLFVFTGLLFMIHNRQFVGSLNRHRQVYMVFGVMALLGGSLAFVHGEEFYSLAESLLRNTIQPVLIFLTVYLAIEIFGIRFVANTFLLFAVISSVAAIFQFVGFDPAWDVRRVLGSIQGDPPDIKHILRTGSRPMGLVFTPILFSYHLVCGYVIANILYRQGLMNPLLYAIFTVIALFGATANGTRSLVLAILVSECLQLAVRGQLKSYVLLAVGAVLAAGGFYYLETVGSRVVSADDSSAVGRFVLLKFGLQLVLDNPLGYGWGVKPGEYAWLFWEELSHLPKASSVFRLGIHNAFVNFLLQYGIFGFSIIAMLAVLHLRKAMAIAGAFLAYFINAMFHNAGVFVGELYFWYAFAVFVYTYDLRYAVTLANGQPRAQQMA